MRLYTLEDLDLDSLRGKFILVRVDFNVPFAEGKVSDDTRLLGALPTIRQLTDVGARILLASHCGRPKGEPDPRFSLRPVAARLGELLAMPIAFAEDCVGDAATKARAELADGGICLLENLRFHAGEKRNDPDFATALASLADAYVNDAFGTAHRAHASVVGVAGSMARKAAGRLLVGEVSSLSQLLDKPEKPFVAVVGGAKIEGKVDTLINLLPRLDALILGGGMANTFLAAAGNDLADSLVEEERIELAKRIAAQAKTKGVNLVLPQDLVVTDSLDQPLSIDTVAVDEVPPATKAVDIGVASAARAAEVLASAGTIFWNGPMGVFEKPPFDKGTVAIANAVAESKGYSVIGGGETVAAVRQAGVAEEIGHISTGGGAALELLAGKALPGVTILEQRS